MGSFGYQSLLYELATLAATGVKVGEFVGLDYLYASFFTPSDVVLRGAASVSELVVVAHDERVDAERLEFSVHELRGRLLHHLVVKVEELNAVYASCVE